MLKLLVASTVWGRNLLRDIEIHHGLTARLTVLTGREPLHEVSLILFNGGDTGNFEVESGLAIDVAKTFIYFECFALRTGDKQVKARHSIMAVRDHDAVRDSIPPAPVR